MPDMCTDLVMNLSKSVDKANNELIDHMTSLNLEYKYVCIKPNVTYDYYYQILKKDWDNQVDQFINRTDKCNTPLASILELYNFIGPENINKYRQMTPSQLEQTANQFNPEDFILDRIATSLMKPPKTVSFSMKKSAPETLIDLAKVLHQNCSCQVGDIYRTFSDKYMVKYRNKFIGKTKDQVKEILQSDLSTFKKLIEMAEEKINTIEAIDIPGKNNIAGVSKSFGIPGISVASELDKLIPDSLGSLKQFFIKVMTAYFDNLHPVVWAQMFKQMADNIFIDLPFTPAEFKKFVSKYALLNGGPFTLKTLQLVRPVLPDDVAQEYGLTKLTYPQLKPDQVERILSKVVKQWDMYKVLYNKSASVGHVSIVHRVDKPDDIFVMKIIKPLSVAQSCWEYKTLYNIYPAGSCESDFIKNMLESNGRELNVLNEKENVKKGHEYYTAKYKDVFGVDINAALTTIQVIEGIIADDCWFAFAMTLAPGLPLSDLVENDLLKNDTKYRAKLHRCLDLLIYKFFQNVLQNGFYHGDPHAGNIFFSYTQSVMTLIDFGAVGHIDIYENDESIHGLLDIIVMSFFYNYDEMLDKLTILLNEKCPSPETQIDMNSDDYKKFKEQLRQYHLENIKNSEKEKQKAEQYKDDIFGEARIKQEKSYDQGAALVDKTGKPVYQINYKSFDTIYSYLEHEPKDREVVVENKDTLPVFTEILGDTESVTFSKVLEMIIKFYASKGVNIAIKFSDFYEFQKAYALLLGVLNKVGYNSYRTGIAMKKAIVNWENIPQLRHLNTTKHVISEYWEQSKKYDELKNTVQSGGNKNYQHKYLKYKSKYLQLKNI